MDSANSLLEFQLPRCVQCGYDLRGSINAARCPECGHDCDGALLIQPRFRWLPSITMWFCGAMICILLLVAWDRQVDSLIVGISFAIILIYVGWLNAPRYGFCMHGAAMVCTRSDITELKRGKTVRSIQWQEVDSWRLAPFPKRPRHTNRGVVFVFEITIRAQPAPQRRRLVELWTKFEATRSEANALSAEIACRSSRPGDGKHNQRFLDGLG